MSKEKPTTDKKVNDQGTYTKFPNIIFDECTLPDAAQIIFFRLCRHVCHRNNIFVGSIRKLSNLVRISKSTVDRMLPKLEEAEYIKKEWDEAHKQMIIHVLIAPIWEQNKARTEDVPDLGPHNSIIVPKWDRREINYLNRDAFVPDWDELMESIKNGVPKRDKSVPIWDGTVPKRDKSVPAVSSNRGTTTVTTITTETTRENAHVSDDNAPLTQSSLSSQESTSPSEENKQASANSPIASDSQKEQASSSKETQPNTPKENKGKTGKASSRVAKPARPEIATEFANGDEQSMWERLGYDERVFYADWDTQARRNYADWCSLFTSRPTISQKMFDAAKKWAPTADAAQKMGKIKDWCFKIDRKTANYPNGYYNTYGVNFWDVVEKAPSWELLQEREEKKQQEKTSSSGGQKSVLAEQSGLTRPELYKPEEDHNPLRESALTRQWIDPKKRNRIQRNILQNNQASAS